MAWISMVAFRLNVKHRWLPSPKLCGDFLELNLRTYVRCQAEAGIAFLSIHANRRLAVALSRCLTPLPYRYTPLSYDRRGQRHRFSCRRVDIEFQPTGKSASVSSNSLDAWLLERYLAFIPDRSGRLYRMAAQHPTWNVQRADGTMHSNTVAALWSLDCQRQPDLLHFAEQMPALISPFELLQDGLA
jgi:uncharacterized protein YqjF (DUF2071 family)